MRLGKSWKKTYIQMEWLYSKGMNSLKKLDFFDRKLSKYNSTDIFLKYYVSNAWMENDKILLKVVTVNIK